MTTSSDAAEQLIRIYLEGAEVALKVSGVAAKNVAAAMYAISQDKNKTKGKIRLTSMLKTGKELKIFSIKREDLKKFAQEAKRYGVLYCALMDKANKSPDGMVDIMVRAEDASKINRIVKRFNLTTLDQADVKKEIELSKGEKGQGDKDIGVQEKSPEDKLVEDIMSKPIQKEDNEISPSISQTAEKDNQLENFSENKNNLEGMVKNAEKPSVKEELRKIKNELEKKEIKEIKEKKDIQKKEKIKKAKDIKSLNT